MDGRGEHGGAIAIVGIACQFPGARDPAEFHDLTVAGRTMFRPVSGPSGRNLYAALLDGWGATPYDTDPIHKLAAETIALALTDAGLRSPRAELPAPVTGERAAIMDRARVGLLVASSVADVCEVACTGFGIDPALRFPPKEYPSSLHAIAAACDALRAGELDVAIAGGAELGIDPRWLAQQAAAGTLGTTQMRVYDTDPVGVLPGHGCGIAILVRAEDARAQAKPSYAEIAGWTVVPPSANGPSLMPGGVVLAASPAPDQAGLALLSAYDQAGIDPADVHFIEGHGAGTAVGETAELETLARLRRGSQSRAALGAVSASIGHTRAASGVASLIKTVTAMVAGIVPPGTGCPHPHPLLEAGDAQLRLPAAPEPWPETTRLAAVNSSAAPPDLGSTIHLVLRRDLDKTSGQGRRRRPAAETKDRDQTPTPVHPRSPSPGRHSAPTHSPLPAPAPVVPMPSKPTALSTSVAVPAQRAHLSGPITALAEKRNDERLAVDIDGAPTGQRTGSWVNGGGFPHPTTHNELTIPRRSGRHPIRVGQRAGREMLFAFCGVAGADVAAALDVVAESAAELGDAELRDLARQLAASADRNALWGGELLRVAVTAAAPDQLAAAARRAAGMVRTAKTGTATKEVSAGPGMAMSVAATGTLTVVFPGFAQSGAEHTALLAGSLDALRELERLGTRASTAVGYSFGEVTGLVWAGCLSPAEAARIAALRGRVLRGCMARPTAMARVHVDVDLARKLVATDGKPSEGLHIAAYETATSHLLACPASAIRDLARRGAEIGVPVNVLPVAGATHSPALADCVAPLLTVLTATPFEPPRRGLISTVTGQPVTADEDIADLLAEQITRPVLFAQAMALAAKGADLAVVAGPGGDPASGPTAQSEPSLAALAAAAGSVPAIGLAREADAATIAALFTAGAIKALTPLVASTSGPGPSGQDAPTTITAPPNWTIPPARNGRHSNGRHSNGSGREAAAQSAEKN